MRQIRAEIIYNKKLRENYFHMALSGSQIAKQATAGQFIHVRISDKNEPLLRRPFSIHKVKPNLEILYEVKGRGTQILSDKKVGEKLDIIGPLGNGFNLNLSSGQPQERQNILVAGGMGIAPLFLLAEKINEIKNQKSKIRNLVLIGSKTKNRIMCNKEFEELGYQVKVATEDGSAGQKGLVTDLLKKLLIARCEFPTVIYSCGPKPMLASVAKISANYKIPCQVSLEEFMGCGIGACLGCVIKCKSGFKRVCKDGPVFDAQEIDW